MGHLLVFGETAGQTRWEEKTQKGAEGKEGWTRSSQGRGGRSSCITKMRAEEEVTPPRKPRGGREIQLALTQRGVPGPDEGEEGGRMHTRPKKSDDVGRKARMKEETVVKETPSKVPPTDNENKGTQVVLGTLVRGR